MTTIREWERFNTNWTNQGSYRINILGDLITIQCIGAIYSSLRREDCSFTQTRSLAIVLYNTLLAICIEESGMHEDLRWVIPQSTSIPDFAACYTQSEFAKWTGSTQSRSEKIHRPTKANWDRVTVKLVAATSTIVSQAYHIPLSNNRTRIAKKKSKSWFSSSRITRTRILSCRTWRRLKKFTSSAKVEEVDHRHGQYGDLRALRTPFQDPMPRLCFILGNWHCILHMR